MLRWDVETQVQYDAMKSEGAEFYKLQRHKIDKSHNEVVGQSSGRKAEVRAECL